MKKTIITALALVAAASLPVLADQTANDNTTGSQISQTQTVDVDATVATNGGIANTSSGSVTKTETNTEADRGGIANTSTGTVSSESNNKSVEADRGGIVANGTATKDSNNVSLEADRGGIISYGNVTKDSGNADDGSIVATGAVNANKAEDDGIAAGGNVRTTDIEGSFNKQETEIKIGDVAVMISTSDLSGQVEDNRIDVDPNAVLTTGNINNEGQSFSNSTGITIVKQNTGLNSLMQTSVNINANVAPK